MFDKHTGIELSPLVAYVIVPRLLSTSLRDVSPVVDKTIIKIHPVNLSPHLIKYHVMKTQGKME